MLDSRPRLAVKFTRLSSYTQIEEQCVTTRVGGISREQPNGRLQAVIFYCRDRWYGNKLFDFSGLSFCSFVVVLDADYRRLGSWP